MKFDKIEEKVRDLFYKYNLDEEDMNSLEDLFSTYRLEEDLSLTDIIGDYWYLLRMNDPNNGGRLWKEEYAQYEKKVREICKDRNIR